MSDWRDESVIPMPPVSMAVLEAIGKEALEILQPECLLRPLALDVVRLVDFELQQHEIFVVPASHVELPNEEGQTDPVADETATYIKIREDAWHSLFAGGRQSNRARATVAHELSHALIHVPTIRRRLRMPHGGHLLNRVQGRSIEAFRSPEWQAWALGGCLLAPRATIELMPAATVAQLSATFQISESFMEAHLRRLKLSRSR